MVGKMEENYTYFTDTPVIRRARGYFLYTADSRRFLDFYQDNGRAVLGHRPGGIQRVLKSTAGKGLFAPYPSVYEGRVERMLKKLFPEALDFRVYRSMERIRSALPSEIKDPLYGGRGPVTLWRPFSGESVPLSEIIVPLLPFPGDFGLHSAVIFDGSIKLPPSDTVSPFLSDSIVKVLAHLERELLLYSEEDLSDFDSPLWKRKGRYLVFDSKAFKEKGYHDFYQKALKSGVFLPPGSEFPGIIPLEYEKFHVKEFLELLKRSR